MTTATTATDQQLIQLFVMGDSSAFDDLIKRHKDRIFTAILMMVKERAVAEDIFQEVFIKIIDTLRSGSYAEEGKFLPWALRIAHNLSVDYFRKAKRNPVVFNKTEEHDMFESMDLLEEGAEGKIIRSQGHELVRRLLDTLPQEQREVIVLRHFANLSFKEIAEKTNCSINTALGRMRYGLINLRKLMEEYQVAV